MSSYAGAPAATVSIRAYLVKELPDQLWIRDKTGTWIVDPSDVTERADWEGVHDPSFTGEPHVFQIRDGADISEVRRMVLTGHQRPLALGDPGQVIELVANNMLEAMADVKMLAADAGAGDAGPPPATICMKDDTGWGIVTKKDD
jgi:hypothetical protein